MTTEEYQQMLQELFQQGRVPFAPGPGLLGPRGNAVMTALDIQGMNPFDPPPLGQGSDLPFGGRLRGTGLGQDISAQDVMDFAAVPSEKKPMSFAKYREKTEDDPFDLLDYSLLGPALEGIPDVKRFEAPKGASKRLKDVLSQRGLARKFANVALRGAEMMPESWYGTRPLYEIYLEELGPEAGRKKYIRDMFTWGGTSNKARVHDNIRMGSFYQYMLEQDLPLPEGTINVEQSKQRGAPQFPPRGYGSISQGTHLENIRRLKGEGTLDPRMNPKLTTFATNLLGNESQVTIDTHNFRLLGMLSKDPEFLSHLVEIEEDTGKVNKKGKAIKRKYKINPWRMYKDGELTMKEALKKPTYWASAPQGADKKTSGGSNEYKYFEDWQKKIAKRLGMRPAEFQEKLWIGGGNLTGLESPPEPVTKTLEKRIKYTADMLGADPDVILRKYVRGEIPLAQRGDMQSQYGGLLA